MLFLFLFLFFFLGAEEESEKMNLNVAAKISSDLCQQKQTQERELHLLETWAHNLEEEPAYSVGSAETRGGSNCLMTWMRNVVPAEA